MLHSSAEQVDHLLPKLLHVSDARVRLHGGGGSLSSARYHRALPASQRRGACAVACAIQRLAAHMLDAHNLSMRRIAATTASSAPAAPARCLRACTVASLPKGWHTMLFSTAQPLSSMPTSCQCACIAATTASSAPAATARCLRACPAALLTMQPLLSALQLCLCTLATCGCAHIATTTASNAPVSAAVCLLLSSRHRTATRQQAASTTRAAATCACSTATAATTPIPCTAASLGGCVVRCGSHALPLPPPAFLRLNALERPHPARQRLQGRHLLLQLLVLRLQRQKCRHLLLKLFVLRLQPIASPLQRRHHPLAHRDRACCLVCRLLGRHSRPAAASLSPCAGGGPLRTGAQVQGHCAARRRLGAVVADSLEGGNCPLSRPAAAAILDWLAALRAAAGVEGVPARDAVAVTLVALVHLALGQHQAHAALQLRRHHPSRCAPA